MTPRSMLGRMAGLPSRLGQRLGLLDHIPDGLPPGAATPRHTFRWDLDKTYLRTEFDSLGDLTVRDWQPSYGGALRIAWNLATLVTIDYGRSSEDTGFYINFNHIF